MTKTNTILIVLIFLSAILLYRVELSAAEREVRITISFAGDCTLGTDDRYGEWNSFVYMFSEQNNNYGYFLENVKPIFENDDLTVANLETTLTTANIRAEKEFTFKGPPEFANILLSGSVEAVNVANNHTYDYLQRGYDETLQSLDEAGIPYFGLGWSRLIDVKGINVGLLGYKGWDSSGYVKNQIESDIALLRENGADLVFVYFHWGAENVYYPNYAQTELGRHAIDSGADLVYGSHPHVMQGFELYNDKYIAYSMGNFCYGGHKNPSDKDTYILQYNAAFTVNESNDTKTQKSSNIKIIPCLISAVKTRNDYRPTPAYGSDYDRITERLNEYSEYNGTNLYTDISIFLNFADYAKQMKERQKYHAMRER